MLVGPLNLTNVWMRHADFSGGQYEGVNFSGAEFDSSKWDNVTSFECNFQGASFWDVMFKNATFAICDFGILRDGKHPRPSLFLPPTPGVEGTKFIQCNFAGANFPMGIWNSVSFEWCNFANSVFINPFIGSFTEGGPQFMEWASNDYNTCIVTNNPKAWLDWSRDNLH